MKNLLIFIHPSKKFRRADYHKEMEFLVKVQVDNSLAFGWKREDIMMVTNFPHEYNGVKTIVVPDELYSPKKKTVSKINAILKLFEMGTITEELMWFHDFDAFQNAPLGEVVLSDKLLALTRTSGGDNRLSTGVMFFNQGARGLFEAIQQECKVNSFNEERALGLLRKKDKSLIKRLEILNLSHNFAIRDRPVAANYSLSDKPLGVLHFHPFDKKFCSSEPNKTSLAVVCGDNSLGEPLIGATLKETFKTHGLIYN